MELLTINGACDFLGYKKSTIYNKIHKREIPFIKMGHLVRFDKAELVKYLQMNSKTTESIYNAL